MMPQAFRPIVSGGFLGSMVAIRGGRSLAQPARPISLGQAFPEISEKLRLDGPRMPIHIGLPASVEQALRDQGQTPPAPEELNALVDTGASITAIRVEVAMRLGLPPTGSVDLAGVVGTQQQTLFGARVYFPDNGLTFDAVPLVGVPQNFPGFDVLIGRNMLCSMLLSYDGPRGRFSLTKAI